MGKRLLILIAAAVALKCAAARADNLNAKIAEVLADNKAAISLGSSAGVKTGMAFNILNDKNEQIGTLTILEAGTDKSTGVYFMFSSADAAPKPGAPVTFTSVAPASAGHDIIVPTNTVVELFLDNTLSSQENRTGDMVSFSVLKPVFVSGVEVIPLGAKAYGEVTEAKPAKGYGKSGRLEFNIKFVIASDGTNVPLTFEMTKKQDSQVVKAAIGIYMTGALGGGAVKGKKVTIEKGTLFNVFVPADVKLNARQIVPSANPAAGQTNVAQPASTNTTPGQQNTLTLAAREKRNPENIRIAVLGFNDTFNDKNLDENTFLAKKLATFIAYKLQWDTPFKFINQSDIVAKTDGEVDSFYSATGTTLSSSQRYNIAEISKLGREMGADYVVAGDIIKYSVEEYKKVDKARRIVNWMSIGAGETLEDTKRGFTFTAAIDIAVIDTKTGAIVWNQLCTGEHKGSKWLEQEIDDSFRFKYKGKTYVGVRTIDIQLRRSDDPISFAGTEEAVGVMRTINLFVASLTNLR